MLGFTHASLIAGLLAASLHGSRVLAADCGSTNIRSAADADTLRQNCPVVTGSVTIGPFTDNTTMQHINLDGVEVIEGSIKENPPSTDYYIALQSRNNPPYTLSSSTLKTIGSVRLGLFSTKMLALSLPNLTTVHGSFTVDEYDETLDYLDITKLESVQRMTLGAPNLTTLHLNGLRNTTYISLLPMKLKSLDNLLDRPLNLTEFSIYGEFPNIDNISLGFKAAESIWVSANLSVTLGGSSTGKMTIGTLDLSSGVTDLKRSPQLTSLEVTGLALRHSTSITHLHVPFDNLQRLFVNQFSAARSLKRITVPPQAVNWTGGFSLSIIGTHELNMTSMYDTDDQGHRIQTWYWPTNVFSVSLRDVNVGNPFFDTFISQQMAPLDSTPPPSVLGSFYITPSSNTTNFTCAPFVKLMDMGRLPESSVLHFCYNSTDINGAVNGAINGAISLRVPSLPILVGVVLGASVWAL